jgi:hypothetical protein
LVVNLSQCRRLIYQSQQSFWTKVVYTYRHLTTDEHSVHSPEWFSLISLLCLARIYTEYPFVMGTCDTVVDRRSQLAVEQIYACLSREHLAEGCIGGTIYCSSV